MFETMQFSLDSFISGLLIGSLSLFILGLYLAIAYWTSKDYGAKPSILDKRILRLFVSIVILIAGFLILDKDFGAFAAFALWAFLFYLFTKDATKKGARINSAKVSERYSGGARTGLSAKESSSDNSAGKSKFDGFGGGSSGGGGASSGW